MTSSQRIGATILLATFGLLVVLDLGLVGLKVTNSRPIGGDVVRIVLTLALMYCVWLGMSWAKWVTAVLLLMGGLLVLIAGLALPAPPLLALGGLFLATAICLFVPPVQAFLAHQTAKRG